MSIKLGCIADDFTGATDLANNLVRAGMRTVADHRHTRRAPARRRRRRRGRAQDPHAARPPRPWRSRWRRWTGCGRKALNRSTSSIAPLSTARPRAISGPVADALKTRLGTDFTIATPAFPDNKRTVFKGHLFVGDVLLNESGMQHHPLTPMTDPNLLRVLAAQTTRRVGLIDYSVMARGSASIRARIRELKAEGVEIAIVDAISNDDLLALGPALAGMPLVTAGSGVAIGLPGNWGLTPASAQAVQARAPGLQAVVAGSCSAATNAQVATFIESGRPALALDPLRLAAGDDVVEEALTWADARLRDGPVLVYSTAQPEQVRQAQGALGAARAGAMIEDAIARIAVGLVERGVRQLIVAGGETSGAVVQALGLEQIAIGEQIDPGVPWCSGHAPAAQGDISIALKSGNFGTRDFFIKAFG
jgi:uncharacterized protein YgbK (DUF1537 family)